MSDSKDQQLGMNRRITRRDFINGFASSTAAAWLLPFWSSSAETGYQKEHYPPALTGLRGSNEGSYEVAHQLRDGTFDELYGKPHDTRETYDLIIVGAGISGLAAALFFRKHTGPATRILILDNHDDFGGHARRQEFGSGKSFLLGHGGSFAIESPAPYSPVSKSLIEELGIDVTAFPKHFRNDVYSSEGLNRGFFFDKPTFGKRALLPDPFESYEYGGGIRGTDNKRLFLEGAPWSEKAKQDLDRLLDDATDYLPGLTSSEKKARLARISYADYLKDVVKCDSSILPYLQARPHSLYGAGIDIVPAQDAWGLGYPGFQGLGLDPEPGKGMNRDAIYNEAAEKYFFHFPDGNASIARLMVRSLIPRAMPGKSAEDIVMARARYDLLDAEGTSCRIRLNSTVVQVKHNTDGDVEISYVSKGKHEQARASKCVLACWNAMIPYICPELPRDQKTALAYAIKVPLLFTRVAVRNWSPWSKLKIHSVHSPGHYFSDVHLSMPLTFQGYATAHKPEEPMMLSMFRAPCQPGLPVRQQHRVGRAELLEKTFEAYERTIRQELVSILEPGGFDPAKDISGIAVHRWPHGYAYQYNSLSDPFWLNGKEGPCVTARKPFGQIAIANSDSGAYAYVDSAIDQAYRAIQEVLKMKSSRKICANL
jgi:spermidine dehydrogenase